MTMKFKEIPMKDVPEEVVFRPANILQSDPDNHEGISFGSYVDDEGHTVNLRRVHPRRRGKTVYYVVEYSDDDKEIEGFTQDRLPRM